MRSWYDVRVFHAKDLAGLSNEPLRNISSYINRRLIVDPNIEIRQGARTLFSAREAIRVSLAIKLKNKWHMPPSATWHAAQNMGDHIAEMSEKREVGYFAVRFSGEESRGFPSVSTLEEAHDGLPDFGVLSIPRETLREEIFVPVLLLYLAKHDSKRNEVMSVIGGYEVTSETMNLARQTAVAS